MAAIPVILSVSRGRSADFLRATPNDDGSFGGTFSGAEPITYTVWPGGDAAATVRLTGPPNGWTDASLSRWMISFSDAQTQGIAPGRYELEVDAALAAGRTGVLFRGLLDVLETAGTGNPSGLISPPECLQFLGLSAVPLTNAQYEAVPRLIAAASDAIERWCHRAFAQAIVVEDTMVSTYGAVRLRRPPINRVLRVQADPREVLTAANPTTTAAWAYLDSTGDILSGRTVNGIVLNWYDTGVLIQAPIAFADLPDPRIASLGDAINAVGSGWTSWVHADYGEWPVTELSDLGRGSGASPDDRPAGLAGFHCYTRILTQYKPSADAGERTGVYEVGRRDSYSDGTRWGAGGEFLFSPTWRGGVAEPQRVRFTYDGGFAAIPPLVVQAAAEWVRAAILRFNTDLLLRKERADLYEYELNDKYLIQLLGQMPPTVMSLLSSYRISMA